MFKRKHPSSPRVPPGPRGHLLLGSLPEIKQDPLGFYQNIFKEYGNIVRVQWGWSSVPHYLVSHPDDIEYVLQKNQKNFPKGSTFTNPVGLLLGQGLFSSDGDTWLRERRLVQPAFHPERLMAFEQKIVGTAGAMVQRWEEYADSGQTFDVASEMTDLALRVVCQTLFGADIAFDLNTFKQAARSAMRHVRYRMTHPFSFPEWIPTPRNRNFIRARTVLNRVVYDLIKIRRSEHKGNNDLLSMLVEVEDSDTGERMNDRQLRDETITFLFAGHETLASALTWTLYLLAGHPAVQASLDAELKAVLNNRPPTLGDLAKLSCLRRVFEESLRLYPPVWSMRRQAIQKDKLGGYEIPAGSIVILCQYVTHRHSEFWEDPEGFDPERFTPERSAERPRFAYLPFGAGARQCIGNHLAMMEGQLILATLLQQYRIRLAPGHPVEPDASSILRPRNGLWSILTTN